MKTLIVYPTYALSKDEAAYRVVTKMNAMEASHNRPKTAKASFYSTSPMLGAPARPRRADEDVEDITDEDGQQGIGGNTSINEDDNPTGATVPVGDILMPMMLMLLGYVLYRRLAAKLKSL